MKVKSVFLVLFSLLTFAMSSAQEVGVPQGLTRCAGDSLLLIALHDAEEIEWNIGLTSDSIWVTETGGYFFTELGNELRSDTVHINFTPVPDPLTNEEHVTCFGLNDGNIEIFSIAGVPIESVIWNGKLMGSSIFNLFAGEYNYVFTDINGCSSTGSVVIDQPSQLEINNIELQSSELNVLVSGGTPPYSYFWNGEEMTNPSAYENQDLNIEVVDLEGCLVQTSYTNIQENVKVNCRPYFLGQELIFPCFRDGEPNGAELYTIDGKRLSYEPISDRKITLGSEFPQVVIVRYQIDEQFYSWRIAKVK